MTGTIMGANRKEAGIPICTHRYEKVMGLHRKQKTQPTHYWNHNHSKYKIQSKTAQHIQQYNDKIEANARQQRNRANADTTRVSKAYTEIHESLQNV